MAVSPSLPLTLLLGAAGGGLSALKPSRRKASSGPLSLSVWFGAQEARAPHLRKGPALIALVGTRGVIFNGSAQQLGQVVEVEVDLHEQAGAPVGRQVHWLALFDLQKILTTRRGLDVLQRLRMWEATIRSCLLYGLDCLPLTPALRHDLNKFAMKTCAGHHCQSIPSDTYD